MANRNANLWKTYGGKGFAAEYSEYSERASADVNGNSLEVGIEGDEVTGIGSLPLHAAKADTDANGNSLSLGLDAEDKIVSIGGKEIAGTGGSGLIPPERESILGGGNGSYSWKEIGTEEVTGGSLLTTYDGMGLKAARAVGDADGNSITATYATKAELPTVNDAKLKLQLGTGTAADTGFTANSGSDVIVTIPEMEGATAQDAGSVGLVPAPTVADKDKFLKGDGTWGTQPEVDLSNYYYDVRNDGLSACRTNTSNGGTLLRVNGDLNATSIRAGFSMSWGGSVNEVIGVNTSDPSRSFIRFGTNTTSTAGLRYFLPEPVANKVAQTNSFGEIVWGDAPESVPTPSVDNSLLTGNSSGTIAWSQLATETYGELIDDGNGESHYADGSATLWGSFNSTGFGAERAVADQLGNTIDTTYATKAELPTVNDAKLKLQLGSGQATDTGFTANASADATLTIPEMTGATAQDAGSVGLVPAPTVADKDNFLKGDGTWGSPAGTDLTYYYYDPDHNGLSAINSNSQVASLVRTSGTLANAYFNGGFKLSWNGQAKEIITVNTSNENLSFIRFGADEYAEAARRYLLPRPTANKFVQTNSSGEIVWGDAPSPLPTPTHDNELFVGMSDGSSSWKQLATVGGNSTQLLDENNDPILDETGEPIYDDEPILWKTLDDRGFYAERALADSDGQEIKTTYSTVAYTDSAISSLAQQVDAGYQRKLLYGSDYSHQYEYILIDGNWVPAYVNIVPNNVVTHIGYGIRTGDVIRFMCKVNGSAHESPNFAIELEPFTAGSATETATVEVYIQPNGSRSAYLAKLSSACSTTVATDKYYQITCVGKCWTIAEFGAATWISEG